MKRLSPFTLLVGLLSLFSAAQTLGQSVVAWGWNFDGQSTVPTGLSSVIQISAGGGFSLALKSDGTVVAWGNNGGGECDVPAGLSGVVQVSAGGHHNLALKSDGTVVAWGSNSYGQSTVPTGLSSVIAVSAGAYHSLALKSDGTIVAWGYNYFGESTVPIGLTGVIQVSAGGPVVGHHNLALKSNGTVVAWGYNSNGECNVPASLSGVIQVSAGGGFSLALKADGTVVAWGYNYNGQSTVPAGLGGVVQVSAGDSHSLALKSDGTVVAWGYNELGECNVPADLADAVQVAAGGYHSLAITVSPPVIASVSPNPVPTFNGQQTFTIYGSNFNGSSVVNLYDLTKQNTPYPNRTIAAENATQINITPTFGVDPDTWAVEVVNGSVHSNLFQFTVQAPTGTVLPAPTLVSPGNATAPGPLDTDNPVTFTWNSVTGADRYDLFISQLNSSGGYDLVFNTQTNGVTISGSSTSYQLPIGVLQTGGSYRWNMSTHNGAGSGSANATRFYFQTPTATSTLPPPSLIGPGISAAPGNPTTTTPTFNWQPVSGADGYDLFVSQLQSDGNYSLVFSTQTPGGVGMISGGSVSYALPSGYLQTGQQYRWNMSTHNSAGSGAANSSRLYFNVATPSSNSALYIPSVIPSGVQQRDWGQTVTYKITVEDSGGIAVPAATVTVNDGLKSPSTSTALTNSIGQASYQAAVPIGIADGTYQMSFKASASGHTDSGAIFRTVQVQHLTATPTVQVTSPKGGEIWLVGSTHNITAAASTAVNAYHFQYSTGGDWMPITTVPTTVGGISTQWRVPSTPSTTCRVRATVESSNGTVSGESPANFTVMPTSILDCPQLLAASEFQDMADFDDHQYGYFGKPGSGYIHQYGCALCCLAMSLSHAGVPYRADALDDFMVTNTDFYENSDVKFPDTVSDIDGGTGALQFVPDSHYSADDSSAAKQYLADTLCNIGAPVIVGVSVKVTFNPKGQRSLSATHYVLVTGMSSGRFIIRDPGARVTNNDSNPTFLDSFGDYLTRGYIHFSQPGKPMRGVLAAGADRTIEHLSISVGTTADLQVTNPEGNVTGPNELGGAELQQIPNSVHLIDSLQDDDTGAPAIASTHSVEIDQPESGLYEVKAVGLAAGRYQITLTTTFSDGSKTGPQILSGFALPESEDSYFINIGGSTDLSLTSIVTPSSAKIGDSLTYTLTVTNSGSTPASAVNITDSFPTGSMFTSGSTDQYIYDATAGTVTFTCSSLDPGATATVNLAVQATAPGILTNSAKVSSFETDVNPSDNTATVQTSVSGMALSIAGMNFSRSLGFTLSWTATSGTEYQVQRSADPSFTDYTVIAQDVSGIAPLTQFTDNSAEVFAAPRFFYRVSLQPQ